MSDLIYRKALLEKLKKYSMVTYIEDVRKIIESQPSAEPKKGKWINEGWYADEHDHHAYCCSNCGKHYIKCPDEIVEFKFCPNCGAKMEMEAK